MLEMIPMYKDILQESKTIAKEYFKSSSSSSSSSCNQEYEQVI